MFSSLKYRLSVVRKNTVDFCHRLKGAGNAYADNKKEFGEEIANMLRTVHLFPHKKDASYMRRIEDYIDRELAPLTEAYQHKTVTPTAEHGRKIPIWVCWFTGFDSAPEVVQMCFRQLQRQIPQDHAEIIPITGENYTQYITLPDHIVRKQKAGIISMAHFSDIIRFSLLSTYGGLWIDSTVFLSDRLPENYLNAYFYTQKSGNPEQFPLEPSKAQWCGFIMGGQKQNILFQYVRDALLCYWEKHNAVVDYVLFDYIILVAYHRIEAVRSMLDAVLPNNETVWDLFHKMTAPYTETEFKALTAHCLFHKLTYRLTYPKTDAAGNDTFYGHLIKTYGTDTEE